MPYTHTYTHNTYTHTHTQTQHTHTTHPARKYEDYDSHDDDSVVIEVEATTTTKMVKRTTTRPGRPSSRDLSPPSSPDKTPLVTQHFTTTGTEKGTAGTDESPLGPGDLSPSNKLSPLSPSPRTGGGKRKGGKGIKVKDKLKVSSLDVDAAVDLLEDPIF